MSTSSSWRRRGGSSNNSFSVPKAGNGRREHAATSRCLPYRTTRSMLLSQWKATGGWMVMFWTGKLTNACFKHCPLGRITDKLRESIAQLKRCGSWALTTAGQAVITAQSGAVTMTTTLLIAGVILRRAHSYFPGMYRHYVFSA